MLEPKVRTIGAASSLLETAGAELMGLFVCRPGPAPEDWENFLVLSLIAKQQFLGQPLQFQQAYADVVLRLRSAGMLIGAAAQPALTREGRAWMQRFSANYL